MKTDPDDLILRLSENLEPVSRSKKPSAFWAFCLLVLMFAVGFVIVFFHIRPEFSHGFDGVDLGRSLVMTFKPLYFLSLSFICLSSVLALSRPDGALGLTRLLLLVLSLVLIALGVVVSLIFGEGQDVREQLAQPYWVTVGTLMGGGGFVFGLIYLVWLRYCATNWPKITGALAAIGATSLIAGAYGLHCPQDSPLYWLIFYFGPLLIMGLIGGLIGKYSLKW